MTETLFHILLSVQLYFFQPEVFTCFAKEVTCAEAVA